MSFLLSPVCNESQIDSNGNPLSGGTIETYLAGTSTPAPTYTSTTGVTPQTNPIVLNTLGLSPQPIWLDSSSQYKFIIKDAVGNVQRTIDNIAGISSSIPVQDQWVVYFGTPTFIDATHFSVAGDRTFIFQPGRRVNTTNTGGVVYSTIISSVFGAVTTVTVVNDAGNLDSGLSSVSYALLSPLNPSEPTNRKTQLNLSRATVASSATTSDIWNVLGNDIDWTGIAVTVGFPAAPQAGANRDLICSGACSFTAGPNMLIDGVNSGSTIVMAANDIITVKAISTTQFRLLIKKYSGAPVNWDIAAQDFRLSLITGAPVITFNATSTTLFCVPYKGNRISLYDGANWNLLTSAQFSVAIPAGTNAMHDVFCYDNAGIPTLETLAWTNNTTRATALDYQNGVLVKSGDPTRRYLGSLSTDGVSGECADTEQLRLLWNYYHRINMPMSKVTAAGTWVYTTDVWRQANADAANQLAYVVGVSEDIIDITVIANSQNNTGAVTRAVGIGIDSTTVNSAKIMNGAQVVGANEDGSHTAKTVFYSAIGRHFAAWLERSTATGVTTWNGTLGFQQISGITGIIKG